MRGSESCARPRASGWVAGVAVFAVALAGAACSHQKSSAKSPQSTTESMASCPIKPGSAVQASVANVHDGVAIAFTAPEPELAQLRANVRAMERASVARGDAFSVCSCLLPNQGAMAQQGAPGKKGAQQGTGAEGRALMQPAGPVAVDSSVDTIPTGAVLNLRARDRSQVDALRKQARENVDVLQAGCMPPR